MPQIDATDDISITQLYFRDVGRYYGLKKKNKLKSAQNTDQYRTEMICKNTKLVISIAKKYIGFGVPLNDLISAGNLGLCVAWSKYDPNRLKLRNQLVSILNRLISDPIPQKELSENGFLMSVRQYGKLGKNFEETFGSQDSISKTDLMRWIENNIRAAKFSSVASMWIRAYILLELENHSALVRTPGQIPGNKTYLSLDTGLLRGAGPNNKNAQSEPEKNQNSMPYNQSDFSVLPPCYSGRKEFANYLEIMMEGIPQKSRSIILKKFGIGLPHPLLPREIARQEGLSLSRITQLQQQALIQMKENCKKNNIDAGTLFELVSEFQ